MRRSLLRSRELYDFGKRLWVIDCQIREHFPVDADLFLIETGDETGIRNVVQPRSGVDASNPQGAKLPFLCSSVSIRVGTGFIDVMFCDSKNLTSSTPIAFGLRQEFLPTPMGGDFIL